MQIDINNIYVGKIMKYNEIQFSKSLYGSVEKSKKYAFVKNAFLVKVSSIKVSSYQTINLYIELEKLNEIFQSKKRYDESVLIHSESILYDKPRNVGTTFVDSNSVKKYNYKEGLATGISSKQNQKVKTLVRQLNKKGE